MKAKQITVGIKSVEESFADFKEAFHQASVGHKVAKKGGLFFESIQSLRVMITPKRIELIRTIHQKKPQSAYQLAKLVQRDVKSVMTDLTILESLGLVELERQEEKVLPMVDYDKLQVEIAV